ncbi:hypothetical protein M378DRAFT_170868, partial [Amanita muscaria Koide BX008]
MIKESRNNFHHVTKDGDGISPVCFDAPSAPVLVGCGHLYCAACIHHCLTSAVDRKRFPFLCIGDEDRCKVPIAIPIIRCATPDCSQIYRCDGNKQSFNCSAPCNRIQCHCGAHICWICLAAFNDSSTVYSHLSGVHGGVFII